MENLKILVACEFSGIVREAFAKKYPNYSVTSVDIEDTEQECSPNATHIKGDIIEYMNSYANVGSEYDILIAFPPCTHLAVSGARWFHEKIDLQYEAITFVEYLYNNLAVRTHCIKRICIENPVGILSRHIGRPTQMIQPYMFGHAEKKRTCLWLKGLPRLRPTDIVIGRQNIKQSIYLKGECKDRAKFRSRTFTGIAEAMADTWGNISNLEKHDNIQQKRRENERKLKCQKKQENIISKVA